MTTTKCSKNPNNISHWYKTHHSEKSINCLRWKEIRQCKNPVDRMKELKDKKRDRLREEKLQILFKHIDPKYIDNHSNSKWLLTTNQRARLLAIQLYVYMYVCHTHKQNQSQPVTFAYVCVHTYICHNSNKKRLWFEGRWGTWERLERGYKD